MVLKIPWLARLALNSLNIYIAKCHVSRWRIFVQENRQACKSTIHMDGNAFTSASLLCCCCFDAHTRKPPKTRPLNKFKSYKRTESFLFSMKTFWLWQFFKFHSSFSLNHMLFACVDFTKFQYFIWVLNIFSFNASHFTRLGLKVIKWLMNFFSSFHVKCIDKSN